MTTRYTSRLIEEREMSFKEFVLLCATCLGAYRYLDENELLGGGKPKLKVPCGYEQSVKVAKKKLKEIQDMSDLEIKIEADKYNAMELLEYEKDCKHQKLMRDRYTKMLSKVQSWTPPITEYEELKEFMCDQLTGALEYDVRGFHQQKPRPITPKRWKALQMQVHMDNIKYYEKARANEKAQVEKANAFIQALYDDLDSVNLDDA